MNRKSVFTGLLVLAALAAIGAAPAKSSPRSPPPRPRTPSVIASAMKAAPMSIARNATIVAMETGGAMRTVRKGTNSFTCMPDNPATPAPIRCASTRTRWRGPGRGWRHQTPPAGKVGFMYMLAGGTDASNTDPYATKPAPTTIGSRREPTS